MESAKPVQQHEWLTKLVGTWNYEHPMSPGEGQPVEIYRGVETFRKIGDLWVQSEATGTMPGGDWTSQMTLGFDPAKGRYVGTWLGTMMANLWVYDGELDANNRTLRLYSSGPRMDGQAGTEPYMDVVEFVDDNYRTLAGHTQGADGQWKEFMKGHYRRLKA